MLSETGKPAEALEAYGLARAINEALALPDIKAKMAEAGADIIPMSVDQFNAFMQAESAKYARIIQETGIKPE